MAGLGWIHFSNTTRQKVIKIIDLLGEKGAIDELGIGVIRNAFSNEMFSGISTIMTRARYYFIVPYLLIDYLRSKPKEPIEIHMSKVEMDIMEALTSKYPKPDKEKIIGHTIARKNLNANRRIQELVRKPSEIYWGGIRDYGLFKRHHSFSQLCQAINQGKYNVKSADNRGDDVEKGDDQPDHEKWQELFDVPYSTNWNKEKISLSPEEAQYLKERIIRSKKNNSLLSNILQREDFIEEFLSVEKFKDLKSTKFFKHLDEHNQKVIQTAIQFWDLIKGAHIRFNIIIQNRTIQKEKISFDSEWNDWLNQMESFDWGDFDNNFLWRITDKHSNINWITRQFIKQWIQAVRDKQPEEVLDSLVIQQEKHNKKERSKLLPQHQTNYDGWVGIDRLDYRLYNVKTILKDIQNPENHFVNA